MKGSTFAFLSVALNAAGNSVKPVHKPASTKLRGEQPREELPNQPVSTQK